MLETVHFRSVSDFSKNQHVRKPIILRQKAPNKCYFEINLAD